jgi:phage terminase large subunit
MRDFFDLLKQYNLYHEENHNKSENIYHLHGNEIEFFGLDEPQKVRGRKRKYLWCNEVNEFTWEDFFQLKIRTKGTVLLDYNPSEEKHWIYDKILTDTDCTLIKSTFKDNPYLDEAIRKEIERLQSQDENYWTIYGLGEIGHRKEKIYDRWTLSDTLPDDAQETIFGLDFGFVTSPASLVEIRIRGNELHCEERIYERGLTNDALCRLMDDAITGEGSYLIADSAEPKSIEEIAQYKRKDGSYFNIHPATKGADSVTHGIGTVRKYQLFVTKRSVNLQDELQSYSWKTDRNGEIWVNENGRPVPISFKNHLLDGLRYAVDKYEQEFASSGTEILFDA